MSDELAHELRVIARLMENKAPVTFREQDAAHLRKAAAELEDMRAILDKSAKLALTAVHAERAAILELVETTLKDASLKADAAAPKDWSYVYAPLLAIAAAIRARGEQFNNRSRNFGT
jgi:hypothetical protein